MFQQISIDMFTTTRVLRLPEPISPSAGYQDEISISNDIAVWLDFNGGAKVLGADL
jgi:hypothetical protein